MTPIPRPTKFYLRRRAIGMIIGILICAFQTSCALIELAGDTVVFAGKATITLVKVSATIIGTGIDAIGATVRFFAGDRKVPLAQEGNSYYVKVRINGQETYRLLLDTGASSVQITHKMAKDLGIDLADCRKVKVGLADGRVIDARSVILDELKVGSVEVDDVHAIILPGYTEEGLLGMSFLENFIFSIDPEVPELVLKCK